jgi:long-chain fatty acid transport protein
LRNRSVFLVSIVCFPAFVLLSTLVHAQTPLPFDELGAGPRATAMGQAFTALADDPGAAYYNPAGLTQIRSPAYLSLGYLYAKPRVNVKFAVEPVPNPYLGRDEFSSNEDFATHGLYVGFVSNFGDVSAFKDSAVSRRFTFGLSLFTNLPEINQFDNPQRPQDPYVFRYNERWSLLSIAISFGAQITEWLSVGGGILPRVDSFQDSTGSWIILNPGPDDPSQGFRMDLRQTSRINVVPIGGLLIRPPLPYVKDKVSLGLAYRGKMWGFYGTGPTAVDILIRTPGKDPILVYGDPGGETIDYIGFNPEQISCGVGWKPLPGVTFAFDATYKHWSAFHFFWDEVPFDEIYYVDPSTGDTAKIKIDTPFNDVWVWRTGLEYAFDPGMPWAVLNQIREVALRAGYYRENSPVPYPMNGHPRFNMNGPMNILDADQNVFSCGFGIGYDAEWTGVVKLEAYFQAHLLENNIISNDHDMLFGPVTVGGQVYNAGAALSIVY